jgi:hypothetical protein
MSLLVPPPAAAEFGPSVTDAIASNNRITMSILDYLSEEQPALASAVLGISVEAFAALKSLPQEVLRAIQTYALPWAVPRISNARAYEELAGKAREKDFVDALAKSFAVDGEQIPMESLKSRMGLGLYTAVAQANHSFFALVEAFASNGTRVAPSLLGVDWDTYRALSEIPKTHVTAVCRAGYPVFKLRMRSHGFLRTLTEKNGDMDLVRDLATTMWFPIGKKATS